MKRSAPRNRRSEDVRIIPIIVAELEFGNVQRHVFGAHLVERPDHAAFEDRPETLNRIRVDRADDVLALGVVNGCVWIFLVELPVAFPLISAEQADLVRDGFADKFAERVGLNVLDHAGDHIALSFDRADDRRLARTDAASAAAFAPLVFVFVLRQATDESFVNLDNAAKLVDVLHEGNANLVAHAPRSFVGTEAHEAENLKGAHSFLTGEHEMNDAEPIAERLVRVLEDRPGDDREPIARRATRSALGALPVPATRRQVIDGRIATARANDALGPSSGLQVSLAGIFVREHSLELSGGKLMDRLWLPGSSHKTLPTMGGYSHTSGLMSSKG
jgi:hypothetical protein